MTTQTHSPAKPVHGSNGRIPKEEPSLACPLTNSPETMTPQAYGLTKPAYGLNELMSLIPFKRTKIYELIRDGKLRATKCGRRIMFLSPDVAAFLSHLQQEEL